MELYDIQAEDVIRTIEEHIADHGSASGKQAVINQKRAGKYRHPLKVVFLEESDRIVVITAYPLRKGQGL